MDDYNSIRLCDMIIKRNTLSHKHAQIFDNLEIQPDWENIPNRRMHPAIPHFVREQRFKSMQNRHYIGRQRFHLPEAAEHVEMCPRCNIENNILHLMLNCPGTTRTWNLLQLEWEILIRSYKDKIGTPFNEEDILEGLELILPHHKLFGVPTPSRSSQPTLVYIFNHTLDIFLGNMQRTIIRQFKDEVNSENYQFSSLSLYYEWRHYMIESLTLITVRIMLS